VFRPSSRSRARYATKLSPLFASHAAFRKWNATALEIHGTGSADMRPGCVGCSLKKVTTVGWKSMSSITFWRVRRVGSRFQPCVRSPATSQKPINHSYLTSFPLTSPHLPSTSRGSSTILQKSCSQIPYLSFEPCRLLASKNYPSITKQIVSRMKSLRRSNGTGIR